MGCATETLQPIPPSGTTLKASKHATSTSQEHMQIKCNDTYAQAHTVAVIHKQLEQNNNFGTCIVSRKHIELIPFTTLGRMSCPETYDIGICNSVMCA